MRSALYIPGLNPGAFRSRLVKRGDAFDIPEFSVVAQAVQPRKQTANLTRSPINIIIENAALGRRSWERRQALVRARI